MDFITVSEAAKIAAKTEATIYRWLTIGTLKKYKSGHSVLISKAELLQLIEPKQA